MPLNTYDVVVIGAGIMGSCAAYHCQKRGLKTLLLEQFSLGHNKGSSHGKSRIIRYAHTEGVYLPIVRDSYAQIEELEAKRNEKLWKNCGLLYMTNAKDAKIIAAHLSAHKCENTIIPGKEDEFVKLGGKIIEKEKVLSYRDTGSRGVTISTLKNVYKSKKVIFAAGTWLQQLAPELVPSIRAQPEAICVAYWKPKREEDLHYFTENEMPVAIMDNVETGEFVYGLPNVDYPNAIKFGFHGGDGYNIGDDISSPNQELIERPRRHLQLHLKMIDASAPVKLDRCKYTMSHDDHYVIDRLPESKNIFFTGCCSGTGFKVAPAIGKALACWVKNEKAPFDLSFFSLKRFEKSKL
ncbi:unnamed protein product, partial [Mesorhabditis spiculigera]